MTDDTALLYELTEACVEDQRASVSNPSLDDNVRADLVHELLNSDQIFRELDDRPAQPRERIGVFLVPSHLEPHLGDRFKGFAGVQGERGRSFRGFDGRDHGVGVNGELHRAFGVGDVG